MDVSATIGLIALAVLIASAISTRLVLHLLLRRQILDKPNERSSHSVPVPRGLGIGIIPIVLIAWMLLGGEEVRWICAGALVLAIVSWVDDVRHLPAMPRLVAQIGVTTAAVMMFGPPGLVARAIVVILWVGIINQVNFTDGIDGHLGTMLVCFGIGVFLTSRELGVFGLILAAAAAGFLIWNWHPARGFMGDVGSVPLGFLVGWLLLRTVLAGQWAVALILPLFYFFDTFVTYSRRIVRGVAFWRPHREYMYQQAAQVRPHSRVVVAVLCCNLVLIALAIHAARGQRLQALALALVPVVITYAYLAHGVWWGRSLEK